MKLDVQDLMKALEKLGLKPTLQSETKQVLANLSLNEAEYPMFLRPLEGGNLLQMLTFVPCTVQDESAFDLSRLLHMINKELDMPGFGWDEESKTVFYRVVVPCLRQQIEDDLLNAYVDTTQRVLTMFGTIVQAIAMRAMTLDEMFDKAKEASLERK